MIPLPHARVAGQRPCQLPAYCICGAKSPENCPAYKCPACRQREKDRIRDLDNTPPAAASPASSDEDRTLHAGGSSGGDLTDDGGFGWTPERARIRQMVKEFNGGAL
jgi:hypothetical protein